MAVNTGPALIVVCPRSKAASLRSERDHLRVLVDANGPRVAAAAAEAKDLEAAGELSARQGV